MLAHSYLGRLDLSLFEGILQGAECHPVEIFYELISVLNEKEQLVLKQRYGLFGESAKTLAAIGDSLGITRERVRQIQVSAIKKLSKASIQTDLHVLHAVFMKFVMHCGGVVLDGQIEEFLKLNYTDENGSHAILKVALILDDRITQEYNKVDYMPHYRLNSIDFKQVKDVSNLALKILGSSMEVMNEEELFKEIKRQVKRNYIHLSNNTLYSILCLDRRILLNEMGYSLLSWRHVNPRTLSDKVEFVLNKMKEPLHFLKIVEKIEAESFDKKKVSMQAVHNELISSDKFVLIGRGIYAMRTWGFKEGTVSDVLESILSKKGPMPLVDLTQEVLKMRKVKPITIQINLSSKKNKFRKNREGKYELV